MKRGRNLIAIFVLLSLVVLIFRSDDYANDRLKFISDVIGVEVVSVLVKILLLMLVGLVILGVIFDRVSAKNIEKRLAKKYNEPMEK